MRIENTELDYSELEAVGLERYLSSATETVDQWAQRVWSFCRRQEEGEELSRVYRVQEGQTWQERAQHLWANKKTKRAEAVCREFGYREVSDEILTQIKDDPTYRTKEQMIAEEEALGLTP